MRFGQLTPDATSTHSGTCPYWTRSNAEGDYRYNVCSIAIFSFYLLPRLQPELQCQQHFSQLLHYLQLTDRLCIVKTKQDERRVGEKIAHCIPSLNIPSGFPDFERSSPIRASSFCISAFKMMFSRSRFSFDSFPNIVP